MSRITVSFSGVDGSGKTTQINSICDELYKNSVSYKYIWCRPYNSPLFDLIRFFKGVKYRKNEFCSDTIDQAENQAPHMVAYNIQPDKSGHKWRDCLKLLVVIIDFYIFLIWKLLLTIFVKSEYIILDRYIWDAEIELKANYPNINFEKWLIYRAFVAIVPKPNYSIVIIVDTEEQKRRLNNKHEVIPSTERLNSILMQYKRCIEENKWNIVIDGTENQNVIFEEIKSRILTKE